MEEERLMYHYRLFIIIEFELLKRYKSSDFDYFIFKHYILDSENFK
jgi:hypothetical protein